MKIACIGGGPAGLYLGILVKRSAPEHEVVVYERFGPVFYRSYPHAYRHRGHYHYHPGYSGDPYWGGGVWVE